MTTLFLLVCAVSLVFFLVFLLNCFFVGRKPGKLGSRRVSPVVRRVAESQAVDAACGRRLFVHLEEEMAEFLAVHGRNAAALLLAVLCVPLIGRAQTAGPNPSDQLTKAGSDQQASATSDQQIPAAVRLGENIRPIVGA